MSKRPKKLEVRHIFFGSAGDIKVERKLFRQKLDRLNKLKAKKMGILLEPIGWEDVRPGKDSWQERINEKALNDSDLVVLVQWERWGTPTLKYSSGFEEEFELARKLGKEILLYFREFPASLLINPDPQVRKVFDFRVKVEDAKKPSPYRYDTPEQWAEEFEFHVANWLDELPPPQPSYMNPPDPPLPFQRLTFELAQAQDALTRAAGILVEEAQHQADNGQITRAEQTFAKAINITPSPQVLNAYALFSMRIGSMKKAEETFERVKRIGESSGDKVVQAVAISNLGIVYDTRGDLDKAEEYYLKSLAINDRLGRKEGMANCYGNLGNLYFTRGELKKAEKFHLKALAIDEELGRKEGMASQYGNLGILYQTRGDLDKAEEFHLKSLAIEEELGRKEGMASDYGNLGIVYQTRGDLDKAEEFFLKSLAMNEDLGREKGMAIQYGNLGNLHQTRGDLEKAEEFHLKSLAIEEELGRKEGMASDYGNLGNLYFIRGDLDTAEEFHLKSLALEEELGRKEGMASDYGNLGNLYSTRGDLKKAEEYGLKALAIFKAFGNQDKMREMEAGLAELRRAQKTEQTKPKKKKPAARKKKAAARKKRATKKKSSRRKK